MNTINIQTAKTSELVAFYNAHTEQPVQRFASRAIAEKRVAALLAAAIDATESAPKEVPQAKPTQDNSDHAKNEKRAAGVAASWADASVRAARSARHAVTVNGVAYGSVMKAFIALGLPKSKLIRFRGELKKAGESVFEGYDFRLVQE